MKACKTAIALLLASLACLASDQRGQVLFNGLPVPGATITATKGAQHLQRITDDSGAYSFSDVTDGTWQMEISMTGFVTIKRELLVTTNNEPQKWELTILPLAAIKTEAVTTKPPVQDASTEGLLINGSMNNGAASPFAQSAAFGNNRSGNKSLYNGGLGIIFDNSALNAKPYSLTGQDTPKAAYNRFTGTASLGGPFKIPHLVKNGPNFFLSYQWTRNNNASTLTGLVPTAEQRTSQPHIAPQAQALLNLYPLSNFDAGSRYNYQIAVLNPQHLDALQTRLNKSIGRKDQLYGNFALKSTRSDNTSLFGFRDSTDALGLNSAINWAHRLNQRLSFTITYTFSRQSTTITPNFASKQNISAVDGISGNNQQPANWGPPDLTFSSGIAALSDAQSSSNKTQTSGIAYSMLWSRIAHNIKFGTEFRRQQFNYLSQQNARGAFTFTGAATGSDFADFLQGIPDTSSIAYGNADKYLRQSVYAAFANDDWRINPEWTLNAGIRWEYGTPITERYGRLANLSISPDFTAATPVVNSLLQPYKAGIQPRIGIAFHASGSSLVIRAGYGIYDDTSAYQSLALQLAQQPPLSKNLIVQNTPANPLTLANGFIASPTATANTFAVDPHFRPGYAQIWSLTLQRDLPAQLQASASYVGTKGTHGPQDFLPNTYPIGTTNPCPTCPVGFAYVTSNANSTRESATFELRRRLHNGLEAKLNYVFSKSLDDAAALGGGGASSSTGTLALLIAQNWLNLRAERSPSAFDQRHELSFTLNYTSGMGVAGGMLLSAWRGALLKEWQFTNQITAGSGLPENPVYLAAVPGTGFTGTIRPDYLGGAVLNAASYSEPGSGTWGTAGRNSINGPAQFSFNGSVGRTFRLRDKLNLDLRIDATNPINHVTYTSWNTTINNSQFGAPLAANAMRSLQTTLRLRF